MKSKKLIKLICSICVVVVIVFCFSGCIKQELSFSDFLPSFMQEKTYRAAIRYITITPTDSDSAFSWNTAEFTAELLLAEIKRCKEDEYAVISVMNKYEASGDLRSVERDTFAEEIDDWCFDPARRRGDVAMIKTAHGYTVIYFSGRIID